MATGSAIASTTTAPISSRRRRFTRPLSYPPVHVGTRSRTSYVTGMPALPKVNTDGRTVRLTQFWNDIAQLSPSACAGV